MDLDEARAWLRGERSMTNLMMDAEPNPPDRQVTLVAIVQADACMLQQAYYIVKAHNEGLT